MLGARHLSQIQEERDSRENSTSFHPPAVQQRAAADKPHVDEVARRSSDPASLVLCEQQMALQDHNSLLEELGCIEADLRDSVCLDVERQREAEFLRRQENRLRWQDFCYLTLSQRVAKPWVSSYFRKFPMHIYCLPVQAVNHKGRGWGKKKR